MPRRPSAEPPPPVHTASSSSPRAGGGIDLDLAAHRWRARGRIYRHPLPQFGDAPTSGGGISRCCHYRVSGASMGPPVVAAKGAQGTSGRFLRRLRMSHALGIKFSRGMCTANRTRGRDRRKGSWWDRKSNCIAIEGLDFAQDTQEGGADQFELIPDSIEGGDNVPSLLGGDDEFVPETEPQDIVAVTSIGGRYSNQGRPRFNAMLHDLRQIIQEEEKCARQIATKERKDHEDIINEELCQQSSISDMETDDEASWVQDGVDLRGHSQVEEDSWVQDGMDLLGHSQVVLFFLWII